MFYKRHLEIKTKSKIKMFKFCFLKVRYIKEYFAVTYQTKWSLEKQFVFFKHNDFKCLFVSLCYISMMKVSTPKLKGS